MVSVLIVVGIVAVAIAAIIVFLCSIYKVADVDKALIITGGKEPVIKISGGSFIIPIFRKYDFFDLCMLTVKADKDEIKTKTAVPIVADWTAQIRPDTSDSEKLRKAIIAFKERGPEGIINDVKLTLTGAVRNCVASMTPEAVLRDKVEFEENVRKTVRDELSNMGMDLVSLNMQEVTDRNGYYDNIAALDMEEKRLAAENKRAEIDRDVRMKKAEASKEASHAEMETRLAVAEKQRDNDLKFAGFKAETDKAKADADIAGELQRTIRQQEIAAQEGKVEVVRQEQANLAAIKEKEVVITRAQAQKEKAVVAADADASIRKIEANAAVEVAEKQAHAVKIEADANAEKARKEGQAIADVQRQKGAAEAEVVRQKGLAEAEIIKERGLAEAETERAKLMAQAEGEKALADARASNEKVNFEIEKLKIEAEARVEIATKTASIMAEIGKNAEFVNIGGASTGAASGNVLVDTLASIPALMKTLNVENNALNGKDINDEIRGIVASIAEPAKGLLVNTAPAITE